jgi:hypothetical protein
MLVGKDRYIQGYAGRNMQVRLLYQLRWPSVAEAACTPKTRSRYSHRTYIADIVGIVGTAGLRWSNNGRARAGVQRMEEDGLVDGFNSTTRGSDDDVPNDPNSEHIRLF